MEKINVAEILRNCPRDMELNCTMYDNLYFNKIHDDDGCLYKISCYTIVDEIRTTVNFTDFGTFNTHVNSKCVIFPKGKTSWEGFVPPCKFKDGDIIFTHCDSGNTWISIFKKNENGRVKTYADYYSDFNDDYLGYCCINDDNLFLCIEEDIVTQRLATEEEKEKLFKAIKNSGYKWDSEAKTLEKLIVPKFKAGDKITPKDFKNKSRVINAILDNEYNLFGGGRIPFSDQDNWELVPNKFDINTLIPFESKVLVRDCDKDKWQPGIWGFYDKDAVNYPYRLIGNITRYCIPYKGNEHLLGTTNDCGDYYKTWDWE